MTTAAKMVKANGAVVLPAGQANIVEPTGGSAYVVDQDGR